MYKNHGIRDIEGIGEVWAKQLRSQGIITTEDLLKVDSRLLKKKISRIKNFPAAKLQEFISCAELMQIKGLSGQHAEALTKAGVSTLLKLSLPSPHKLVGILDEAKSKGIIPESIELISAINWQKDALKISLQNAVYGRVESFDGPVEGAIVRCQGISAETDENGEFWLTTLSLGTKSVYIEKEGYDSFVYKVNVKTKVTRCNAVIEQQTAIETADESRGEIVTVDDPSEIKFVKRSMNDFSVSTPFRLARFYKNGNAKLISLLKQRNGAVVEIGYTEVPVDNLVGSPSVGEMLIKNEGDLFELSPMTIRNYKLKAYKENNKRLAEMKRNFNQYTRTVRLRKDLIKRRFEEIKSTRSNDIVILQDGKVTIKEIAHVEK